MIKFKPKSVTNIYFRKSEDMKILYKNNNKINNNKIVCVEIYNKLAIAKIVKKIKII